MEIPKNYKGDKDIYIHFKRIIKELGVSEQSIMKEIHGYASEVSYRNAASKDWKTREELYLVFIAHYAVLLPIIEKKLREMWQKFEI